MTEKITRDRKILLQREGSVCGSENIGGIIYSNELRIKLRSPRSARFNRDFPIVASHKYKQTND